LIGHGLQPRTKEGRSTIRSLGCFQHKSTVIDGQKLENVNINDLHRTIENTVSNEHTVSYYTITSQPKASQESQYDVARNDPEDDIKGLKWELRKERPEKKYRSRDIRMLHD